MFALAPIVLAVAALCPSVQGHGAMIDPEPWRMTESFFNKLGGMRRLLKSGENGGQEIPNYLVQSAPMEYWKEEGLSHPTGGAYTLPCRGVSPDGTTHRVTPGGTLRIKYQIDVRHGGDCTFKIFQGKPGSHKQIGSTKHIKGCGNHVNSGVWTSIDVPKEAAGCGGSKFCFVQFYWSTDGHDNGGDSQTYCNCATIVAGGKRRGAIRGRRASQQ
eukprot:comp19245_c0_seq1/m.22025 comp19245_c0_seq1/g.22025  ORF comp19245_c0_seq1/g.22025 comp19245_c0_seq1/m.22025 type:complete len:215 (-) comp19245_c0_seq1:442-1086(-)